MKKIVIVIFVFAVTISAVFAQHHRTDVWGLGVHGRNDFSWDNFYSFGGPGISFKSPKIPLFWDISLGLKKNNWYNLSFSGDYYFIDTTFVEEINLGWFLGIGAYGTVTFSGAKDDTWSRPGLGLSIPIGLSWIYKQKLEVFMTWAPNIGIGFWNGSNSHDGIYFPDGSLTFEAGCRYWFK